MIRDEPHLEELAATVSTGFLAEEVVFALGKLLRGEPLEAPALRPIEHAALLLRAAASPEPAVSGAAGLQQLANQPAALDALHAARDQAPGEDVAERLQRFADVLDAAVANADVSTSRDALEGIRSLFASVGHFSLARANKLSRSREERLTWTGSTETSGL